MKQEFSKNKELQESLRKFREDAKKLEDSQDLKDARRKFESIEGEKVIYCSFTHQNTYKGKTSTVLITTLN